MLLEFSTLMFFRSDPTSVRPMEGGVSADQYHIGRPCCVLLTLDSVRECADFIAIRFIDSKDLERPEDPKGGFRAAWEQHLHGGSGYSSGSRPGAAACCVISTCSMRPQARTRAARAQKAWHDAAPRLTTPPHAMLWHGTPPNGVAQPPASQVDRPMPVHAYDAGGGHTKPTC